jgi:outer membrane lipoprotein-sorting protein
VNNFKPILESRACCPQSAKRVMPALFLCARRIVIALIAAMLVGQGCQSWQGSIRNSQSPETEIIDATVPPFATKEPERYQAVRITTTSESANPASPPLETRTVRVFTVRDGDKRREEYEDARGALIVYLENVQGRFVLLPSSKMYANLNTGEAPTNSLNLPGDAAEISADRLLHESHSQARYQKLGVDNLDGRTTTKYRVTRTEFGDQSGTGSETLIWIDESLGMPIKSETTFTRDHYSKVLMELKSISLNVDEQLFDLPADFKKVDARLIPGMINKEDKGQKSSKEQ